MTPQTKSDSTRNFKKKLRVKYTKMAQMAMIAGLGVLCLSSSVGAAMSMGGGEDDGGSGGSGAGGSSEEPPPECETVNDINAAMRSQRLTQEEAEKSVGCEVPENLQSDVADITYCDVAKTDWINSKMQNDGMSQSQG